MKIIKFPGGPPRAPGPGRSPGPLSRSPTARMVMGPVSFTCTECHVVCSVAFQQMIFRSVDFYCQGCGAFYRLRNPAFTGPPPPPDSTQR